MDQTFFLAANTAHGFVSLCDAFPGDACFLHILKGGPGTGKSGFMKRIRSAAQARSLDTVSILCSGDPDSLDGLCVPALGQAWFDGTAPHAREPKLFGADADYVNLGAFCRLPLSEKDRARAQALNRAYHEKYAAAYQLLSAAAAAEEAEELHDAAVRQEETARVQTLLDAFPDREPGPGRREKRFVSAISCKGLLFLNESVTGLCGRIVSLRGGSAVLRQAVKSAERKTAQLILCPRPLRPEQLEALLLPELGLAFLRAPAPLLVPQGERAMSSQALTLAMEALADAKTLHDKLEAVYWPYMDFPALSAYTEERITELFG